MSEKVKNGDFATLVVRRWREDIGIIGNDLSRHIQLHRQVYDELGRVIAENPRLHGGNLLIECMFRWYVAHVLVAIRREIDTDKRTISIVRLLDDVKRNRSELTRRKHRLLHSGSEEIPAPPNDIFVTQLLDKCYDPFADATGEGLEPSTIQADISSLEDATSRLEKYTNENITHRNRDRLLHPEKFAGEDPLHIADIHAAIDAVESIVKRYTALLTGASYDTFNPVVQFEWKEVFTFPWRSRER